MPNYSRFAINLALNVFNITLKIELADNPARQLENDSRDIASGDIFAATVGYHSDGRDYINQAIQKGAELVIAQTEKESEHGKIVLLEKVHVVYFYELNIHLSRLASLYYQQPQQKMTTIGVTGTNGKTTTSHIIAQMFQICEKRCAVIGTTGAGTLDALTPIVNTTPGPTELNKLLSEFVHKGISHVAMEVSSHALHQHRIDSSMIDIAVFTNLSRDHLDYHQTMEKYAEAKFGIFSQNNTQIAVLNGDDDIAQIWLKNNAIKQQIFVYGLSSSVKSNALYLYAAQIEMKANGIQFVLETHMGAVSVECSLIGTFNISNVLAASSVLLIQNYSLEQITKAISLLDPVIGRMEVFSGKNKPTSIVDYAHTPDALKSALIACKPHCIGRLWVVFGCGGDRDKGKRALMGAVAENNSTHVVLTNDNPRTENPQSIIDDILEGCKFPEKINVVLDRKTAVLNTLAKAAVDDTILFAGKGHENYIVIGENRINYNERDLVQSAYLNKAVS